MMKSTKSILAALALTIAATAGAQTLKMTPQVVRITAYEASTSVNLVVVKPEVKLDVLDPAVFTVETNGVERNVKIVYTCDDRGEWTDGGDYLAFGLEVSNARGAAPLVSLSAATTGMDAPSQRNTGPRTSISESTSSARCIAGEPSGSLSADERPLSSGNEMRIPPGQRARRCSLTSSKQRCGFCPGTSLVDSFAIASHGITVFEPGPP